MTDEQMVEFEKSMEKLRVAAALTDVAERQQRLTEMMKRNQHEREAAKKDGRLPELIDELDRTDGETREVHRELSTSLALLQEMRGQGLDEDIDKVEKMHRWLGELLEMQKTIARSDRTSVEVEQDRR